MHTKCHGHMDFFYRASIDRSIIGTFCIYHTERQQQIATKNMSKRLFGEGSGSKRGFTYQEGNNFLK